MTMQQSERLHYRGRWYSIIGCPLAKCADPWVARRAQQFKMSSTALHRGYLGTWAVARSRLWLVELDATVRKYTAPDEWSHARRGLDWLIPGAAGAVLAEWFSGEVTVGVGECARSGMYTREWRRHRVFTVDRGAIVGNELRDNGEAFREGKVRYERVVRMLETL